jgi:hypothetical protein
VTTYAKDLRLFLCIWVAQTISLFFYGHVIMSTWVAGAGNGADDLQRHLEFLSLPIAWANPRFIITPETGIVAILGITIANAYAYALALFPCVRIVQSYMRNNRVTQLGISHTVEHFDTYEIDEIHRED